MRERGRQRSSFAWLPVSSAGAGVYAENRKSIYRFQVVARNEVAAT